MAHNHLKCTKPSYGEVCTEGHMTGYCDYEADGQWECGNEYCTDYGQCSCLCHSGKSCEECGYYWPRMEKSG